MIEKVLKKLNISNRQEFIALIIQFVKFGLVGLSNTFISLAVYYAFLYVDKGLYLWGNLAGFFISVLNAFYWGNKYVFKSRSNTAGELLRRLGKSYITYGATFLLSTALLFVQVEWLGVGEWLAPILNLILTIPLNFFINKYWTFKG